MATHRTPVSISITPELDALLQLKVRLEKGAAQAERGELIDGVQVFEELREMIEERCLAKVVGLRGKP